MATITFNTLKAKPVSKKDLQIELAPIRADINLIKWMLGILLDGVMTLILKAFFSTIIL